MCVNKFFDIKQLLGEDPDILIQYYELHTHEHYHCDLCGQCYYEELPPLNVIAYDPDDQRQEYHMLHTDGSVCDDCIGEMLTRGERNEPVFGWIIVHAGRCPFGDQVQCIVATQNFFERDKPFTSENVIVDDESFWIHIIDSESMSPRGWSVYITIMMD